MITKLQFRHSSYTDDVLNASISDILNSTTLMSVATIYGERSWINTAFFCFNDKGHMYFLTTTDSQHSQNLKHNKSVAVTVFDSHQDWAPGKLKGLQIFGECQTAQGGSLVEGITLYVRRFPAVKQWMTRPDDLLKGMIGSWIYVVKPHTIKLFDEPVFGEENYVTLDL